MISWFFWGAVYLARAIEYAVQAGLSLVVSFVRFLLLAGHGAVESGVDCSVVGIITIALMFVSVTSELFVIVLNLRGANQLSSPVQKRVMSAVRVALILVFLGRGGGRVIRRGCYV